MRRESNHAFLFFLILTSQFVGNHNLKKLTNNLRLRILDAFSIIYYPEKWCERKEQYQTRQNRKFTESCTVTAFPKAVVKIYS